MFTFNDADSVFHALAHKTRRAILDLVKTKPGCSVGELAVNFDVSRIAVMNHLTVLERAGLIISEKDGRTRRLYLNVGPIQLIYDRWTDEYSSFFVGQMTGIKHAAETRHKKEGKKDEQ